VATELQLIKAGLNEPGKPASVLLLAGMTGVGKTELAKRLADLYSTSKQLNTYSMGNFTEQHTVSGIIGVPPGYVGHEQGGRLINELNADPYQPVEKPFPGRARLLPSRVFQHSRLSGSFALPFFNRLLGKLQEKLDYMHLNPVRAGLVEKAVDWPWSSARYYLLGRSVGLPIGWPPGI